MKQFHISQVDLNLLKVLHAVLSEGSVSRAASRLNLTQPAVSHALGRLRGHFEDPLLVRGAAGMEPTPLAKSLFPRVEAAIAELEGLFSRRPSFDPVTTSRTVVVGAADYAAFVILPRLLQELKTKAPGLRLIIRNTNAAEGLALLESGEVEMLWGVFPNPPQRVRSDLLFHEDFVVAGRSGHPAFSKKGITVAAYASADHVNVSLRGEPEGYIDAVLATQGIRRTITVTLGHFLMAPHVLPLSDLIATEPRHLLEPFAAPLGLTMVAVPARVPGFDVSLLTHNRSQGEPALDWLRTIVSALFSPKLTPRSRQAAG